MAFLLFNTVENGSENFPLFRKISADNPNADRQAPWLLAIDRKAIGQRR